ncbi:MAG: hypothetical protein NZL88_11230, partial [Gaiellaceae bacterium]|nr:hypothetical protein [Gaiellaceae bacterium]
VQYLHIPEFDSASQVHTEIAAASKAAHAAVAHGDEPDEDAVDRAAAQLWDLTEDELDAMRRFHDQLRKRDLAAT